jgi:subtilisin
MVYAAVRPPARVRQAPDWGATHERRKLRFRVVDPEGRPVAGARVIAYADPRLPLGAARRTRKSGVAVVPTAADATRLPRVTVEPPPGYVPVGLDDVSVAGGEVTVQLQKVDPAATHDALARWRADLPPDGGAGVRIGVVDTGVNVAHPDLAHVRTQSVYAFDAGPGDPHPHANHVAGLIGARGPVFRGLAPAAEVCSYRVTALGERDTTSFFLGEGIEKAATGEDLHLINVSMTQKLSSAYLAKATAAAYQNGAVCIGAAGNEGRDIVSHPAGAKRFLAVSAYCDIGALPADAPERADVSDVVSRLDRDLSRAKFSNWGSEVDFIAPGVGIVSCYGAEGYAVDSGTSFATPIVTGLAAVMLSRDFPHILAMPKDSKRAAAITQALLTRGRDLGFRFETQGNGILYV